MNRSVSARQLKPNQLSRTPSKRVIYINEEVNKRQLHTPFHSPYKDGKPNPQYYNPSFISSHLFYPKQNQNNASYTITSNLIPNHNDIQKDTLYRQRMKTQMETKKHSREKWRKREFNRPELNRSRVLRSNEPQSLLKNELTGLQVYRENMEKRQHRVMDLSRRKYLGPEEPVYLQKLKSKSPIRSYSPLPTPFQNTQNNERHQLNNLKRQLFTDPDNIDNYNIQKLISQHQEYLIDEYNQQRKQKEILGNILREQIKTNNTMKERRWHY